MKLLVSLLALAISGVAQNPAHDKLIGDWTGTALVHGQQVPLHLRLSGSDAALQAVLINGPENGAASSASFSGSHLLATFSDYARTIDATISPDGKLTGTFGTAKIRYPISLTPGTPAPPPSTRPVPALTGDWEIAVNSVKGEAAWQLHIDRLPGSSPALKAVIQRIDGDTGSLYGQCDGDTCRVSHFSPAGPALYQFSLKPSADGAETLLVSNLLRADQTVDPQQNLVARRPAAARAASLPAPTDPSQQTTMKDPTQRFAFSAPDLSGRRISNTDPQFDGKVVIVSVGGSWCPNCHDEAPLLESLYKRYHSHGLEIVNLSFEEDEDQLKDPARLRAFIARYHLDYTVLLAGTTDQLNKKIPQADNLNCWPTSFILGRDGRVRQVHAGFAGPANPSAHEALVEEMNELVVKLLGEPVPTQNASLPAH